MQVLTNTTKNWVKTPIVLWTLIATLFMMTGVYVALQANTASAGTLTSVSDTMDTSAPSATAAHSFTFTTATALDTDSAGVGATDFNFFLQFPTATGADPFTINAIAAGDVTITCSSGCGLGAPSFSVASAGLTIGNLDSGDDGQNDNIKIEVDEDGNADGTAVPIGAVFTVAIDNDPGITSPADTGTGDSGGTEAADFYQIDVETREDATNTTEDSGTAAVGIIEGITVQVTVDESINMNLDAVAGGGCTAGDSLGTAIDTTIAGGSNPTLDYATVNGNAFYNGCFDVDVGTNSSNGYSTTIEKNQLLTNVASDTIADGNCDATCNNTTVDGWATATNNGWGYCLDDSAGNAALTTDASDDAGTGATDWVAANQCDDATPEFKTIPTASTVEPIMKSFVATSLDTTRMLLRLSVPGDQEAGVYSSTVTLITTPVF